MRGVLVCVVGVLASVLLVQQSQSSRQTTPSPVLSPQLQRTVQRRDTEPSQPSSDSELLLPAEMNSVISQFLSPDQLSSALQLAQAHPEVVSHINDMLQTNPQGLLAALSQPSDVPVMSGHGTQPLSPDDPIQTIASGFKAVATILMLKILLPMLVNPALVLQFISPKMMTVNYPALPATFREADAQKPDYFHPYGRWGDYGYEAMGYQGYGCAKGNCAPWWWQWTRRNKQFAPFSKTSPMTM